MRRTVTIIMEIKLFYLAISMDIGLMNILGQMILHGQIK
jgi:hypothetical protein